MSVQADYEIPFTWVAHVHKEHPNNPPNLEPGSQFAVAIEERIRHWLVVKGETSGVLIFPEGFSVEWRAGTKGP